MGSRKRAERPASKRQLRVAEEIRHVLAEVLMRGGLRDPDLRNVSVTVSEVSISPDLKSATAFVTALGGGDQAAIVAGLNRAAGWLRGQVARLVRLRFAPALRFEVDETFDRAERIDILLRRSNLGAGGFEPAKENDDGA